MLLKEIHEGEEQLARSSGNGTFVGILPESSAILQGLDNQDKRMHRMRTRLVKIQLVILAFICTVPAVRSEATTGIILHSRYRIVLAVDSRAVYRVNGNATECKLFEMQDVYATVSGLAHYGSFRVTDSIREGFAGQGTFENHVSSTALALKRRVDKLLANLQVNNPTEYRYLTSRSNYPSDLVQLAVAETVKTQPMLGIIELRWNGAGDEVTAKTIICLGSCSQNTEIFYLGYWEQIKPYVGAPGRPRNVASAASIDKLIRLEINAHPTEVGIPINILELTGSGARWLQNGGNCSLPGVGS